MKGLAAQADLYVGMDLDRPRVDFVAVARGLGLTANRATTLSEMRDLLEAALAHDGPTLLDVEVDRSWKPV
jgi:thiamine pyrophosphate-dependent acetolactate synthase large subunit-like protein